VSSDLSGFSMIELFRMEAESHTATLSTGLVALESSAVTPEIVEPLMRAAHSLKGAARIVGLEPAVRVAHAMEDCFVAAQKGNLCLKPHHVDVLLRGVDLLSEIAQLAEQEVDSLVAVLTAVRENQVPEPDVPTRSPVPPVDSPPPRSAAAVGRGQTGAEETEETGKQSEQPVSELARRARDPERDRIVRVTAESLSRLMGLAGEALVQTQRLRPLADSLWRLRGRQTKLLEGLQLLEDRISSRGQSVAAADQELLANAKSEAALGLRGLGETVEAIEQFARGNEELSSRLHHEVLASRMRPLSDGIRGFPRLVRDLARELGKEVRFVAVGETTGVDRDILDRLEAPLNHLIRNALDHGLEAPEERCAAGKAPVGTIRLEAHHRAGSLHVTLSDDGRGIDPERLRTKIVERGLTTAKVAQQLSESELLEFLFLPGFSTKQEVTQVSGRGVGLDVVQSMVRSVQGSVRVTSRPGQGTRFVLQLPITVSVIRGLLVEIAGEPYAFPLNRIERILTVNRQEVRDLEGKEHVLLDDQLVGLVEGARVLELLPPERGRDSEQLSIAIASDHGHRFGVVVDRFLGERDLRVFPLDARLGKVPNVNSASVLEDDWPVLIVDVEDLIRSIDNLLSGRRLGKIAEAVGPQTPATTVKKILVVDDSITVRELERQLLESRGYAVDTAIDGLDGWNAVRTHRYDLVVSDIDMPRMDGIEFVRHIKEDARLRTIPVVVVSYKDREEDRIKGLDAGANCYLTKSSFHDQTFLDTVSELIGEARD
jgi:two-component system, chemotaxis family, sensor histidine kinase and response regulator WspE